MKMPNQATPSDQYNFKESNTKSSQKNREGVAATHALMVTPDSVNAYAAPQTGQNTESNISEFRTKGLTASSIGDGTQGQFEHLPRRDSGIILDSATNQSISDRASTKVGLGLLRNRNDEVNNDQSMNSNLLPMSDSRTSGVRFQDPSL